MVVVRVKGWEGRRVEDQKKAAGHSLKFCQDLQELTNQGPPRAHGEHIFLETDNFQKRSRKKKKSPFTATETTEIDSAPVPGLAGRRKVPPRGPNRKNTWRTVCFLE